MRDLWKGLLSFFLLLLLTPLLLILLLQGRETMSFSGRDALEAYLPMILARQLPVDVHMETIKAQAVLTRSNVTKALEDGQLSLSDMRDTYGEKRIRRDRDYKKFYEKLAVACEKTRGEVITYEKNLCYAPFFLAGGAVTRDAFSSIGTSDYPHVISVPGNGDEKYKSYITTEYYEQNDFYDKIIKNYPDCGLDAANPAQGIQIMERDGAEYVLWLRIGSRVEGGESFRAKMNLASSNFSVETEDNRIRILCKGQGHGFGFSQYGADTMAREGKDYKDLLAYYFHGITVEKSV